MYRRSFKSGLLSLAFAAPALAGDERTAKDQPPASAAERYRDVASRIVQAALDNHQAFERLEHLCLVIGHRLSGSPQLDRAIEWAMKTMMEDGQENVRREPVEVPRWVRGRESATMLKPRVESLSMLGLGGSVGTPAEGLTAPVLVVANEEELESAGEAARGTIVLFNNPMPPYDPQRGSGYGTAVRFRSNGAKLAAQKGAVACLIRSVTARSLRSPHTGAMRYGDGTARIPAAALSIEDAELIARLARGGTPVEVNIKMEAENLPDALSANVVGELRGSSQPEEIVVIGGHIDSWDVGQGAQDDGGGCVMAMEAIHVLRKLNLIPRRTVRVVLWTNEENGLAGAKAYAQQHAQELTKHVAGIESDSGVFAPQGYSLECKDPQRQARAVEQMREVLAQLPKSLGEMDVSVGHSGADLSPLRESGIVLMGHDVEGSTYFDYHHSHADTIDKVNPRHLAQNIAVLATVAYVLADMPERLGEKAP